MSRPYDVLALDLDGTTLVGEDLPHANKLALREAADAGYEIVIATARWREMAERVAQQIGIQAPMIACSGAQVHDPLAGQDIFDERLPPAFTQELFAMCNDMRCIATVTVHDRVLLKLDGEPQKDLLGAEMSWVPQLQLAEDNLPRIAAIQGSAICELIKQELAPKYKETVNVFDSIGPNGKLIITITAKGASKGAALLAACQHLDVPPDRVVAFGDAENDLAMFEVAGASVAMGQAEPRVKAAANFVTANNDADGVALAVRHLLDHGALTNH